MAIFVPFFSIDTVKELHAVLEPSSLKQELSLVIQNIEQLYDYVSLQYSIQQGLLDTVISPLIVLTNFASSVQLCEFCGGCFCVCVCVCVYFVLLLLFFWGGLLFTFYIFIHSKT